MTTLHLTLKMTTAQVVETSVTNNSLSKDYLHPNDHDKPITDTPGLNPFTKISVLSQIEKLENYDGVSRYSKSTAASRKSFASGTGSFSSTREKRLDARAKAAALRSLMQVQEEII